MNKVKTIKVIRNKLKNHQPSIGGWLQIPNGSVAEILGDAGYDWVAVDMEHGSIDFGQLPDLFRALELGNTLPLVRVAEGTILDCRRALDAGAGGIIVPNLKTAEEFLRLRDACRWPPDGNRGVGFCRANLFGEKFGNYQLEAKKPLLVAMIENSTALQNLESILKAPGLDAVLIGPYDLSSSLGLTGKLRNSVVQQAIAKILKKARQAGVPAGIHVIQPSLEELSRRIGEGFHFIPYSIDAVMLAAGAKSWTGRNKNPEN